DPVEVHTNIVLVDLPRVGPVLRHLADAGVLALASRSATIRMVTHADLDDADVDRAVEAIGAAPEAA
ncbi:MAG TPA: hypothetical protein VJ804_13770, partial [Acidimicrobiales bacterium]|nr:hypothetical protein [Acidimicrobiales bacterium]